MEIIITFILLFSLRTISLAADVTIYDHFNYNYAEPQNLEPVALSRFPWMFSFHSGNPPEFFMEIRLKNISPSVTAIHITCNTDDRTYEVEKSTQQYGRRRGEDFYYIYAKTFIKSTEIKILLNVYTSNILCSSLPVATAREFSTITNELLNKEFPPYNTRLNNGCVLVVDLINKCDDTPLVTQTKTRTTTENAGTDEETINPNNTFTFNSTNLEITTHKNSAIDTKNLKLESSQNIVLIYVIPSALGMCVIILVVYLISVKKYCHRSSGPVETIELNTNATANEVIYADLGFVHGDSQPPRRDEESPYARIVGVLKPAD